jgi:serine/threonine protein kinase
MMKRNDTGEACPFTSHYPNPQWRAPEEQVDENGVKSKLLTEKVDIYALGNVMFRFAVGHSPWKRPDGRSLTLEEKREIANLKMKQGKLPHVPHEIRHLEEPATMALLSVMNECYRHRPELRPSAKEIVKQLQTAIDDYKAHHVIEG